MQSAWRTVQKFFSQAARFPRHTAIFETKCTAPRSYVVTVVGRRNNSDGTVEMWIIADLGPAISLIETYN